MENVFDQFLNLLERGLQFNVGFRPVEQIPENFDPAKDDVSSLPKTYERTIACNFVTSEFIHARNEVLKFLNDLHKQYPDTFQVMIDFQMQKLKRQRSGYYSLRQGQHNIYSHKDLGVTFDDTYFEFYSRQDGAIFKSVLPEDKIRIHQNLEQQVEAVDSVLKYVESLVGVSQIKVAESTGVDSEAKKKQKVEQPVTREAESKKPEVTLYTINDLARKLKVTPRTIYNWKDQGILPYSQVGSKTYISEDQLNDFLKHHEVKSLKMRRGF